MSASKALTFPHMDYLSHVMQGLFTGLGCRFVLPPPFDESSRELGRRLGREGFCQPLNNCIGDIVRAIEIGAEAVVFTAGHDPCRYGFYWANQKVVIEEHFGQEFPFFIIDHLDPRGSVADIAHRVGVYPDEATFDRVWELSMERIDALAVLNQRCNQVRARERQRGQTSRAYECACQQVLAAPELQVLQKILREAERRFAGIAQDLDVEPLRVLLVGAIYEVLEPQSNMQIEESLAARGVVVERSLSYHDLAEIFTERGLQKHMAMEQKISRCSARFIDPALSEVGFGGYGRHTIGHAARAREDGFDGIVHVHSFSCMPEILAKAFLKRVGQQDDLPVMTIVVEEIHSRELFESRIEAFVDLLEERRSAA